VNTIGAILLGILALIVLWIVLKIVFSIATAFFVPLLLIGIGVFIGVWWVNRKSRR
jgi:hypothetical protein